MCFAADRGQAEAVMLLLAAGANINAQVSMVQNVCDIVHVMRTAFCCRWAPARGGDAAAGCRGRHKRLGECCAECLCTRDVMRSAFCCRWAPARGGDAAVGCRGRDKRSGKCCAECMCFTNVMRIVFGR
jgi:hypothetical protein